jgi:predicted component of type VI protein secretion system
MKVQLILQRKGKRIWTTQLRRSETTLGRALGCTIRIPASQVSRLHCRLRIENDLVTVEDLESVNGTFLNGKRVRGVEIVRPGDRLALGSVTFMVEYELTAAALRQLSGGEDYAVLEEDDDLEVVEEVSPPPAKSPPVVEEVEEVQAVEEVEDDDAELFVLEEGEEINLPDGGDLRNFLLELDDTDDRSKGRKK